MRCTTIGKLAAVACVGLALVTNAKAQIVRAENYQAFWLWAGVQPQPALKRAQEVYLLAGEVSDNPHPRIIAQRSAIPHLNGPNVWVVYRAQTMAWNDAVFNEILAHLETWHAAGNTIAGLQIDFDAGTKHLEQYAIFLTRIRERLPHQYKLGVTGLLDWSANGDPKGLQALAGVVDEVVLQIYQTRHVIPGYEAYLAKLDHLPMPFKIGLLQGGDWAEPAALKSNPMFKGYVVFLLNPKS